MDVDTPKPLHLAPWDLVDSMDLLADPVASDLEDLEVGSRTVAAEVALEDEEDSKIVVGLVVAEVESATKAQDAMVASLVAERVAATAHRQMLLQVLVDDLLLLVGMAVLRIAMVDALTTTDLVVVVVVAIAVDRVAMATRTVEVAATWNR